MKEKKQSYNFHFGNKGIIFMLDIIIAVFIVGILLTISYYYIIKSEEDITPNLQITRTGADVITLLENKNLIAPFSEQYSETETYGEKITSKINSILPINYQIKIQIDHKCECSTEISEPNCRALKATELCENNYTIGNEPPSNKFLATGKKFFTRIKDIKFNSIIYTDTFHYGEIKYWIWLK